MSGISLITDLLKIPTAAIKRERAPVSQSQDDGPVFDDHLQDSSNTPPSASSKNDVAQSNDASSSTDKSPAKEASASSGKEDAKNDDDKKDAASDDDQSASTVITAAQALPAPAVNPLAGTPLLVAAQIETNGVSADAADGTATSGIDAPATPDAALLAAAAQAANGKPNAAATKDAKASDGQTNADGQALNDVAKASANPVVAGTDPAAALPDVDTDGTAKQKADATTTKAASADQSAALIETLKPAAKDAQTTRLQAINISAVDKKTTLAKTGDEPAKTAATPVADAKADTATAAQANTDVVAKTETPQADASAQKTDATADVNNASAPVASSDTSKAAPAILTAQTQTTTQKPVAAAQTLDAQVRSPVALGRVPFEIAASAHRGEKQFQIRLDPAELGGIDVTVSVDKHGKVATHLVVERPETLDQLRRDQPNLERALSNSGLKTDSGAMQFSLKDQSGQNQQGQDQRAKVTHRGTLDVNLEDINGWAARPVVASLSQGRGSGVDRHV